MENMESKILDVLNDPEKMAEIMELAKGLGFSPEGEDTPPLHEEGMPPLGSVLGLLQNSSGNDPKQDALLQALLPYLQPERQQKLQRAMKIGKLSRLAMFALKNYSDLI